MDRRKLLLYLLLNVFISACVTGAILFWYDRNYRSVSQSTVRSIASGNIEQSSSTVVFDPNVKIPIEITSIVGAGMSDAELVTIRNQGDQELNLSGWQLKDSDRNVFVFPNLTLNTEGAVRVHTGLGTDNVIDLYWNMSDPIWESGEEATLYDPGGNERAIYKVP